MKKIIALLLAVLIFGPLRPAMADDTTPQAQVIATLLNHVIAVNEFTTEGKNKLYFLDGIIQAGHYKSDYIVAVDAGFCNSLNPDASGRLAGTVGIHIHAISGINNWLNINPALAQTLDLLEMSPRVSWDTDLHQVVYGLTFGARIPF